MPESQRESICEVYVEREPGPPFDPIDVLDVEGLRVAVMRAALELDLFSAVAAGASDPNRLAVATGSSPRGIAVLVRALLAQGWLEGSPDAFTNGPTAASYLAEGSTGDTRAIYLAWMRNRDRLVEAVRSGSSVARHDLDAADDEWCAFAAPDLVRWPTLAPELAEAFAARGVLVPPGGRVLDLGCGSGIAALSLVRAVPDATAVGVDRAPVLRVADRLATEMGLAGRFTSLAGEVDQAAVPAASFDVALLINVAQYLADERLAAVLGLMHAALRPGGTAYLVAAVQSIDPDSLAWATEVEMFLASAIDQRPPATFVAMLERAGFDTVREFPPNRFAATKP